MGYKGQLCPFKSLNKHRNKQKTHAGIIKLPHLHMSQQLELLLCRQWNHYEEALNINLH